MRLSWGETPVPICECHHSADHRHAIASHTGEVITTPYSFVATCAFSVMEWHKARVRGHDPRTYNLDPDKIEAAITPQTSAIMPVHCYGRPCDVDRIQRIADNYGLRLIYDAAHAFGVRHKGTSLLNFGDLSVLSFHATKVFNTFEGAQLFALTPKRNFILIT